MLNIAFDVLVAAALIGAGLAVVYLRGPEAVHPHNALPIFHGALGIAGLALLIAVLHRGLPSAGNGIGDFGTIAAGFFGVALMFGLLIAFVGWRRRRPAGLLVATHASLAIAGVVVLLTLVALQ